jgi:hypothetical protein
MKFKETDMVQGLRLVNPRFEAASQATDNEICVNELQLPDLSNVHRLGCKHVLVQQAFV